VNDGLNKYYELLGVAPGTSGRDLKEAYRDLAKVWHPDRFSHDPRLQQKAQEKLKEINEAYEQLTTGRAGRRTPPSSPPVRSYAPTAAPVRRKRPWVILPTALLLCAVLFAALSALIQPDAGPARDPTPPSQQQEARPASAGQQSEKRRASPPEGQSSRAKERTAHAPSAAGTSGGAHATVTDAPQLRPMPTATVTIDAFNGLLATRDCPTVNRMTYPAGAEPRQYCNVRHKTKVAVQTVPPRPDGSR
jgi:hypothetical protein